MNFVGSSTINIDDQKFCNIWKYFLRTNNIVNIVPIMENESKVGPNILVQLKIIHNLVTMNGLKSLNY